MKNQQFVLAARPEGLPEEKHFRLEDLAIPAAGSGQVVVKTLYLSVDPYMRGRMNDRKSYSPPFPLDKPIAGGAIGQVTESLTETYRPGDIVSGFWGWQRFAAVDAGQVRRIEAGGAPLSAYLGVLGMTGLTAYFGLLDIGKPQPGETVVVSGAAGAVGLVVGQIAKLKGCRVVGIAGSEDKIRYLTEELGFDAALNYKRPDLPAALQEACPNGVDVYFDNVGGTVSDAVLALINPGARIPLCGQISLYNNGKPDVGPRIQPLLLTNTALLQGFLVGQYADRSAEGMEALAKWLAEGKLRYRENIIEGFENTPQAFIGLFHGDNTGKQLVKVADPV